MNPRAEAALARLAASQHGVFTRADALPHGFESDHLKRRVEAGVYRQLASGVFAISGSPPTWLQAVAAARLAGGPGCLASHATSTALHALDGFPSIVHAPRPIEVLVAKSRGRLGGISIPGVVVHVTRSLGPEDVTERFGIPCTTVARTLLDLLAAYDPLDVEHALDAALRDRKVTRSELEATLERLRKRGRRGGGILHDLLDGRDGEGPGSLLERRFFRLLQRANLPRPVGQYEVLRPGGRPAFIDYAYVAERIAIELHGDVGHSTRQQRARDSTRGNDLELDDWKLLTITRHMVRVTPTAVVAQVGRALRERRAVLLGRTG